MSLSAVFAQVSVPQTRSAKGASDFLTYCSHRPCWPLCSHYLSHTKSARKVRFRQAFKKQQPHWFRKVSEVTAIIAALFSLYCLL